MTQEHGKRQVLGEKYRYCMSSFLATCFYLARHLDTQACNEIEEVKRIQAVSESRPALVHVVNASDRKRSASRRPLPSEPRIMDHYAHASATFNERPICALHQIFTGRDSGDRRRGDGGTRWEDCTGNVKSLIDRFCSDHLDAATPAATYSNEF